MSHTATYAFEYVLVFNKNRMKTVAFDGSPPELNQLEKSGHSIGIVIYSVCKVESIMLLSILCGEQTL